MSVIIINGLLISPLLLPILISLFLTIITKLLLPQTISHYVVFSDYWLNMIIFAFYLTISIFGLGAFF